MIVGSLEILHDIVSTERRSAKRIAWTNGCFDMLHAGHIQYLKEAAALADILIVGLNSDNSIRMLKGESRPIYSQDDRAEILDAIRYVDYVLLFDEKSPAAILSSLKPDLFIKGGDYSIENINPSERDALHAYGGEIRFVSFRPHYSTTCIIEKIKNQPRK
jgi:rfaE bifunctional protein nucleotidyltransferase chain/domain